MCPITINKALLLQEGILKFELSWTAVKFFMMLCNSIAINAPITIVSLTFIIDGQLILPRQNTTGGMKNVEKSL